MFLAHARVQSLETRQPALLLAFSLLRAGREREALQALNLLHSPTAGTRLESVGPGVLPRHVRFKSGPSVTDCTPSMCYLRSSPDISKATSKQCGMDQRVAESRAG